MKAMKATTVSQATVMMDRRTQRSRGFGFVDMHRKADAEQAIAALNGSEMNGRDLTVRFAKPRGE
jgi:RNA recognition motif-containing protein